MRYVKHWNHCPDAIPARTLLRNCFAGYLLWMPSSCYVVAVAYNLNLDDSGVLSRVPHFGHYPGGVRSRRKYPGSQDWYRRLVASMALDCTVRGTGQPSSYRWAGGARLEQDIRFVLTLQKMSP